MRTAVVAAMPCRSWLRTEYRIHLCRNTISLAAWYFADVYFDRLWNETKKKSAATFHRCECYGITKVQWNKRSLNERINAYDDERRFFTQNHHRIVCDFFLSSFELQPKEERNRTREETKQKKNWKTFSNTNEYHRSWFEWRGILLVM